MATGYRDSYTYHKASDEIRILLIGKTGAGKSMTGNTILGRQKFQVKASSRSVTQWLQHDSVTIEGKKLVVVDTPGYFDTHLSEDAIKKEIKKCVAITSPGLHAFILVTEIGRMTQETLDVISKCREQFGDHMENYLIVLFTKTDNLEREGTTIEEYMAEFDENNDFKKLLRRANYRYIAFNNVANQEVKQKQVKALKHKIDQLIEENNGRIFSNWMYEEAEKAFQRKIKMERQWRESQEKRKFEKRIEPYVQKIEKMEMEIEKKNYAFKQTKAELERKTALKIRNLEDAYQAQLREEREQNQANVNEMVSGLAERLETYLLEMEAEKQSLQKSVNILEEELSCVRSSSARQTAEMQIFIQRERQKMDLENEREINELREYYRSQQEEQGDDCTIL